jgi:hypothetical protein
LWGMGEKPSPIKDSAEFCSIGDSNSCFSLERATS